MPTLPEDRIRELLAPYLAHSFLTPALIGQLSAYLDLLLRWNARVNLTAIRRPEEIVQRHFGESLFAGALLSNRLPEGSELLDYGSGAGFPGLPIQLLLPAVHVILAESQAKKAAFLHEAIRELGVKADVWPRRVEDLSPLRRFDVVTLRAVDRMAVSMDEASRILQPEGYLAALVGREIVGRDAHAATAAEYAIPGSEHRRLLIWRNVPRGTFQT